MKILDKLHELKQRHFFTVALIDATTSRCVDDIVLNRLVVFEPCIRSQIDEGSCSWTDSTIMFVQIDIELFEVNDLVILDGLAMRKVVSDAPEVILCWTDD